MENNFGELQIVYIPVDQLKPYERNARKHTPNDVEKIKASIEKFGFDDPIGIWGKKNIIVEGHGRLIAAKELGYEKVPCIRLDHLTDEQRRAYGLAHNKTAELSTWDFGKLEAELMDLSDFGMSDFGFDFSATNKELGMEPVSDGGWQPPVNDEGYREYQEPLSAEELKQYESNADDFLMKRRVIITFMPEQEEEIKRMLGITEEKMRVVYDLDELIGDGEK